MFQTEKSANLYWRSSILLLGILALIFIPILKTTHTPFHESHNLQYFQQLYLEFWKYVLLSLKRTFKHFNLKHRLAEMEGVQYIA